MDDRIAISRIKQGDLNGLDTLVNRYQVRAVHDTYLVVYDRALAEDITQSAFVKIVERIHQFDEERPFAPWFFRSVLNDSIKAAKQRKESADIFQQQNRTDLAKKEQEEIEVIEKFLPKQLSADEIKAELSAIISEVGASTPADMGKVMGVATRELAGKADGKTISAVVKELLSKR